MHEAIAYQRSKAVPPAELRIEAIAPAIGTLAIRSLYREVALSPKPGLVSPVDSGSHADMDYRTFLRSLNALRGYFPAIARLGGRFPAFSSLQNLGIAAETRMLAATGGINTHRGAIFNIGLLCAAAGALTADGLALSAEAVCATVTALWGEAILGTEESSCPSHGLEVRRRYGCGGARHEAANGFPSVREIGLPAYRQALADTGSPELAAVQALFALMAHVDDTNLLWRGGIEGLAFARARARDFLAGGGVAADSWLASAHSIHREFVALHLSPGGSADLLGVTLFLDGVGHAPGGAL